MAVDSVDFLHKFAKGILGSVAVKGSVSVVVLVADAGCGDAEITSVGGSDTLVLGADDAVAMLVCALVSCVQRHVGQLGPPGMPSAAFTSLNCGVTLHYKG